MKTLLRNLLAPLAGAVLLLVLVELVLAATDAAADADADERGPDGYDPRAAYLLPDPARPGAWRTNFAQARRVDDAIPPRDGRLRVVIAGASNAHSFHSGRLDAQLARAGGEGRYEVVNLGRGGYGSERVRIVLAQALERLTPDVVLIYTGDNELAELPPRRRRATAGQGSWTGRLAAWAKGLHTVRALGRLAGGTTGEPREPEPWVPLFAEGPVGVRRDQTLARYEGLRENLRAMCRDSLAHGARTVLSTVIYNRFAPPAASDPVNELPPDERPAFLRLRAEAVALLPAFLDPLLAPDPQDRIKMPDWSAGKRPPAGTAPAPIDLSWRRPSTGPLADTYPYGSAPWGWGPKVHRLFAALKRFHARDVTPEERAGLERAEELLVAALERFPEHPRTHFELGLVQYLLARDPAEYAEHLELAADYDRLPSKASRTINGVIREVAAEFPDVLLFDADRIFADRVPDGLVGWEWMLDHCHMARGARRVLMMDLADAIQARWPETVRWGER